MIDLVFVVDDPVKWHSENIYTNPHHYSSLRYLGANTIASIQERMASGVYYNPYCDVEGQTIKYGVISSSILEDDLTEWSHLYIAGRLHKPVADLQPPVSESLVKNLKKNRQTALRAVLLQQGHYISTYALYHGIAELSYLGDTRMRLAENPDKTKNIVLPIVNEFEKIYMPLMKEMSPRSEFNEEGMIIQDITPASRFNHLMALPFAIQKSLARQHFRDPRFFDIEDVMAELSYLPYLRLYIRNAIAEVVRSSSIVQTFQGILTAGAFKSARYAMEKLQKRVNKNTKPTSVKQDNSPSTALTTSSSNSNSSSSKNSKNIPP